MDTLIDFERLRSYINRKRPSDVVAWLNERGIRWTTDGVGNPCTTVSQIDKALEKDTGEFEFGP